MSKAYLTIILFITITFSIVSYGFSQWVYQESHVTNNLHDVCFVDSLYGWAVGDSATVIATTDGGQTWIRKINPVDTVEFKKVIFVNRLVGFVGGNSRFKDLYAWVYNPIILKTIDGGANWAECELGQNQELYFYDMEFSDINRGWVLVNNIGRLGEGGGILLSTENGGNDWRIIQDTKPYTIYSIAFWENYYGYLFTGDSFDGFTDSNVSYTEDGGGTWTQVGIIHDRIRNVSFYSKDTLWAIGNYTWKSEDGGITWDWFHPDVTDDRSFIPRDVYVFDSTRIWLIGYARISYSDYSGVLISTDDCGENWLLELDIPHEGFNVLEIEAQQYAWIVGKNGLIYYRNLKIGTAIADNDNIPLTFELKQNYPNPFNPVTTIQFTLAIIENVQIEVYDVTGQMVQTLMNQKMQAGNHEVEFHGSELTSGTYFYKIQAGKFKDVKKMMLIK